MSIDHFEYRIVGKNGQLYPGGYIFDDPNVALELVEEYNLDVPGRAPHRVQSRKIRIDDWQPYA